MTKKLLNVLSIVSILLTMLVITSYASGTLTSNSTWNTYMNSSKTFNATYLTNENPTIGYRYRNLKCSESNAKLNIKLYSYKINWYNMIGPSETLVGSKDAGGLNASNSNVWYGWTYDDIDCSSSIDISAAFNWMDIDDAYSINFKYTISNNNNNKIYNDYGQWQIIASY